VSDGTAVSATLTRGGPRRIVVGEGFEGRLLYGQVHEDPRLEVECLTPVLGDPIAVVSSGGCTALSLLAAGASDVRAVDSSASQNYVLELKLAAVAALDADDATGFIGGRPMAPPARLAVFRSLTPFLSEAGRTFWEARTRTVARGVLGAGASERFMHLVASIVRLLVHPRERIDRLLACRTLDEQRRLYETEWDSRRWRMLFKLLLGRRGLTAAHDAAMFQHVANPRFAEHFHARFEHTVTTLPVADNYFLHYALTDRYPDLADGRPLYLAASDRALMREAADRVALIDATFTDYLRTLGDQTLAGLSLSNICEWLDRDGIDALFAEIARTARPGAIVCFRNFVGWTEVPNRWRPVIVEDRLRGERLFARDRALVNRRFAVCRIGEGS
jgi:S-adenosylmethionine-diacylglycerol 3-amino-3-carboxypropyl transferase